MAWSQFNTRHAHSTAYVELAQAQHGQTADHAPSLMLRCKFLFGALTGETMPPSGDRTTCACAYSPRAPFPRSFVGISRPSQGWPTLTLDRFRLSVTRNRYCLDCPASEKNQRCSINTPRSLRLLRLTRPAWIKNRADHPLAETHSSLNRKVHDYSVRCSQMAPGLNSSISFWRTVR